LSLWAARPRRRGIRLFKYWLTADLAQQEERFAERLNDPIERWKLSPADLQARSRHADYGRARRTRRGCW
jgi:polyphosphate kinase 2 (PPK2 family)